MDTLEKWEIDLRKQLQEKIKNVKEVQPWEESIMKEVEPQVEKPVKSNHTGVIVALFVILTAFMLFAFNAKSDGKIWSWVQSKFVSAPNDNAPPVSPPIIQSSKSYDAEISALKNDIKRIDAEGKTNLESLSSKIKWNTDRITLMGILLNENFLIIRNNQNKGDLIFFNRDWTLDKMPHYVEISDEDKEYLNKFVKP